LDENRDTNTAPDLEPASSDALPQAELCEFGDQAVRIHIHSVRKRPTDPDGVSAKAAIDGIVEAGVLDDDNCEIVKSVTFSQEQGEEERTVITIQRLRELEGKC